VRQFFRNICYIWCTNVSTKKKIYTEVEKIKNTINLWKSRNLSIYGNVNIIKTLLFPQMIYPSSVLWTPYEVIKEINSLIFRFLWNSNDKVIRLSTYAPYDQGGLQMLDYDNMVKDLRLNWLKRITLDSGSLILIIFWWMKGAFF